MARTYMDGLYVITVATCVVFAAFTEPASAGPATDAIKQTHERVLDILRDEEVRTPERATERREQLAGIMAERFSCTEMARHVLGPQWTVLEQEDRQEFVRLFRLLLLKTYVQHIER